MYVVRAESRKDGVYCGRSDCLVHGTAQRDMRSQGDDLR